MDIILLIVLVVVAILLFLAELFLLLKYLIFSSVLSPVSEEKFS